MNNSKDSGDAVVEAGPAAEAGKGGPVCDHRNAVKTAVFCGTDYRREEWRCLDCGEVWIRAS